MKSFRTAFAALSILSVSISAGALRSETVPLNLPEAIAAQHRMIAEDPQNGALFNDLGNLLLLNGQTRAAEEAYETSIRLAPEMAPVRFNLALLLQQTDRPWRAEKEYRKVLESDPQHAWAHYQTGVLLARRGKRAAAIRSYARAIWLNPRLTDPAFNPHIVENALASSAVLWAYSDLSSAALAPRVYENPGNITSILLGAQTIISKPEKKPDRPSDRKQRRREKKVGPS